MVNPREQTDEGAQLGPDLSGRDLGNWHLLRRIGVGGFGAVYAAENRHIDKQAAVKVLHPHMALRRDLQQRFLAEAGAASKARHPGIVEFYDGGFSDDGLCYMVMELLHGKTLHALLGNGPLSPRGAPRARAPGSPTPSPRSTAAAWSTATSSPTTSCSRRALKTPSRHPRSSTSASPS